VYSMRVAETGGADIHAAVNDAEPNNRLDSLTRCERVVADLVARGASNKQAARLLFVSPRTVEHHLTRIFRKLNVASRAQLAWLLGQLDARSAPQVERAAASDARGEA
jgi:DNA-binding NarL/FixJ family response regulator